MSALLGTGPDLLDIDADRRDDDHSFLHGPLAITRGEAFLSSTSFFILSLGSFITTPSGRAKANTLFPIKKEAL
jgi:hypothetical protein